MYLNKVISCVCFGISLLIYVIILRNMIYVSNNDIFGAVLLNFYIVIPIVSFVCSFMLQLVNGILKWLYPAFFSIFGIVIPIINGQYGVLSDIWLICILPPFIGMGLGWLIMR